MQRDETLQTETISGQIEHIVYHNIESGFGVARIGKSTPIVGVFTTLNAGEVMTCEGRWIHHPEHGRQFQVQKYVLKAPSDASGIQKYLESGLIKGIGPIYAKRIVKKFGEKTLEVIEQTPKRLSEVEGIGKRRLEVIIESYQSQKSIRDVMIFLQSHGVGTGLAQKIYARYRDDSIAILQENPYQAAREIFGVGFLTADNLAQKLGFATNHPLRILAGIEHVLKTLAEEGHTCYPEEKLLECAEKILFCDRVACHKAILHLEQEGRIVREELTLNAATDLFVWLKPLYLSEKGIAREIERLYHAPSNFREIDTEKAISWVQQKIGLRLAKEQYRAIDQSLESKCHIITGGPGTGKSTITKAILEIHSHLSDKLLLAAPTGRAAKRMQEITRRRAQTIHSLLEYDFSNHKFKKGQDSPLDTDLIIIDEASMIDTHLMYCLLKAIPAHARVILIGDIDQLPSVGPGNVLRDLIESKRVMTSRLYQIFRQGKHSRISVNAHNINRGLFPDVTDVEGSDFEFIEKDAPDDILHRVIDLCSLELPKRLGLDAVKDIQILSPMKKGVIGTENLNVALQQRLIPADAERLVRMGRTFFVGDKVMQIRNNYQKVVFNGDIGIISAIDREEQLIFVDFDGKELEYAFFEIDELIHAYAVSVHKYQGSECPCVIMPVHTTHYKLLMRNLLYTGITRGKKHVTLIGTRKAIQLAIHNNEVKQRYTGLMQFAIETLPTPCSTTNPSRQ